MGTVQQFPVQGNPTTAPAATLAGVLRRAVDTKVGPEASFAEREAAALALANDATRQFLQDDLMARVDRHSEHIEVDGACYKRPELGTVRYYTLCGVLDLERWTYRAMGVHNGPTVVPLELEAGLVERTTPALGLRIMLGYAKDHMRSAEEDMKADHRCPPSRSTLERVAKAMGTAVTRVAPHIERRGRQAERVPDGAVAIVLGLDRTAVPMEEDLADGTPMPRRTRPYVRTPPAPVTVAWRTSGPSASTMRRGRSWPPGTTVPPRMRPPPTDSSVPCWPTCATRSSRGRRSPWGSSRTAPPSCGGC